MALKRMVLIVDIDEEKARLADLPGRLTAAVEGLVSIGVVEVSYAYLLDEDKLSGLVELLEQDALDFQAYLLEKRPDARVIRLDDRRPRR